MFNSNFGRKLSSRYVRLTMSEQIVRPESSKEIASKIVNECLRVQPDEQVVIFAWDHTLDHAAKLALEVEKARGVSTTLLQSNDLYWALLRDIPLEQFARRQKGFLSLLDQTDAMIQLAGPRDPTEFTKIPGERMVKMVDGAQAVSDKMVERKIRSINYPIGLVTRERARTYGFNYEEWSRIFNNSINVDHVRIAEQGRKIADKIRDGREVRVTASNGTDLRLKLKGRPVHVRDGILDQSDLDLGTRFESLPAGVIEHAPDEDSAEGTVQFDLPAALAGKKLTGLRWEFKNGHLTQYSATANLESFKGLHENATGDKDRVGSIAIGLNPQAEPIGFLTDRVVVGTVSIAIGGNNGIGGVNNNVYGNEGTLRRPTLEVDGEKLILEGKLLG